MSKGKQTKQDKVAEIIACYQLGMSTSEVAEQVHLPWSTVDGIRKREIPDLDYLKIREAKKQEFIDLAWDSAKLGGMIIKREIRKKAEDENAPVDMREITTAVGTFIDKARLTAGESTVNVEGKVEMLKFEDI